MTMTSPGPEMMSRPDAKTELMQAVAVVPGSPGSVHLREIRRPDLDQVANGRGVLVKVLRVGVDGTDKEINAAEYGMAPPGDDYLVIGHEGFGVVAASKLSQLLKRQPVTVNAKSAAGRSHRTFIA